MSKVIVYVLDKFVWILLVTVITTQALQITGFVESPKTASGDITYKQNTEYDFQLAVDGGERGKRETTEDRSQFIDTLFNIPIKTLTAVNNLVQHSRPAFRKIRDFAMKRFEKTTKAPDLKYDSPVYIRPAEEKN